MNNPDQNRPLRDTEREDLVGAIRDLKDLYYMDFAPNGTLTHPMLTMKLKSEIKRMERVADRFYETRTWLHVYDSLVLEGEGNSPTALLHKDDTEQRLGALVEEFWGD